jgi:hypothetical protein
VYQIRKRRDEMYIIRKEAMQFQAILDGRENTLLVHDDEGCMEKEEKIRFVEIRERQRTGRECYCRIERIYARNGKSLVIYRKEREVNWKSEKQKG